MKTVYVGCCGFPCARDRYYRLFSVVELQNTFYDLPTVEWASRLRKEAPENFTFAVKAWQAITHPSTSPTWKKMKHTPPGNPENYGYLKPTRENLEAFSKILEITRTLNTEIIVFQTPPSMPYNADSIRWVREFFKEVRALTGEKIILGWEVRGDWVRAKELVDILQAHDVLHIVDIFRSKPLYKHSKKLLYTRLHGIGAGEVNYGYNYTNDDLNKLIEMLGMEDFTRAYVMFNNVKMLENGLRLKELMSGREGFTVL